jgi:hypothetical protein
MSLSKMLAVFPSVFQTKYIACFQSLLLFFKVCYSQLLNFIIIVPFEDCRLNVVLAQITFKIFFGVSAIFVSQLLCKYEHISLFS